MTRVEQLSAGLQDALKGLEKALGYFDKEDSAEVVEAVEEAAQRARKVLQEDMTYTVVAISGNGRIVLETVALAKSPKDALEIVGRACPTWTRIAAIRGNHQSQTDVAIERREQ